MPSIYRCRNETGQGLAHRMVIVGVSYDLRGDSWGCVPRSLFWREDLDRVGEYSHTGNHLEDDFTPLETIQSWPQTFTGTWSAAACDHGGRKGNFIYTKDDDDLSFLLKKPSSSFGVGSPSALVHTEPPKDVEEPEVQLVEVT
nr:hypothetical protein [Tanacetum cinerariifolium]